MRLYPRREGTGAVNHGGTVYEAQPDGGFDFPPDLSDLLHSAHANKEPLWEDAIERQRRLIAEDAARRADPATALATAERIAAASEKAAAAMERLMETSGRAGPDEKAAKAETPKAAAKAPAGK
jgi:hypothetical protein